MEKHICIDLNALWNNPITAADAKDFGIIMKIYIILPDDRWQYDY